MPKKHIPFFAPSALLCLAALSGCHHHKAPPPPSPPLANAGLVVSAGRLVLPAVSGNPGAAYFTLVNQGHTAVIINAVAVDGAARAEMHETIGDTMAPLPTIAIRAGGSAIFAPGGKHVMAFSLAPRLAPGTSTQITLTFTDGSRLSAPLKIESVGASASDMGDMAGMKM